MLAASAEPLNAKQFDLLSKFATGSLGATGRSSKSHRADFITIRRR
jgi:hypothetical protein